MEKGYKNLELEVNLLALDNRPCSYKYFQYMCDQSGIKRNIFFSRKEIFEKYNKRNNNKKLKKIFILSLDNFIFDGIVNSRKIEYLQRRENFKILEELFNFIETKKEFDFYLYVSIPRILLNFKDNIEKIWDINLKLSQNFSEKVEKLLENYQRYNDFRSNEEFYILSCRREKLKIIDSVLANFLKKRLKNIKEILVVLDDSQIKGLNFLELRYLKKNFSNFYYLIGLDEVHLLIFAKIILELAMKTKVINFFSNVDLKYKVPLYESVSIVKLLKIYEKYLKIKFNKVEKSDYFWKIFETKKQRESINQIRFECFNKFMDYFEKLCSYEIKGRYIVDLTFANGASLSVLKYFFDNWNRILDVKGFWAWNTFANTLGSSLSHYIISKNLDVVNNEIEKKLVIENFLETVYQTFIRRFASKYLWDERKIKEAYQDLFKRFKTENVKIKKLYLPWNRYFEIDVRI
ncbi:MAG: DUF4127 family protein [bacterium]